MNKKASGLLKFWWGKAIVLYVEKSETMKVAEEINAMYSNHYRDYLTLVFVHAVVANFLEQQRNHSLGAGLGFQGQSKSLV